ncbi:MAG: NUDIX hydrolase [Ornithinibacter sp.]
MRRVSYSSEFPPFYVTCDLVVLSVRTGALHVLLVRRGGEPFAGRLALPGGFVEIDENLEDAAYRELGEEAGVGRDDVILEQLAAYGEPGRDPRQRVVSVAWLALGADLPEPTAGSDAASAEWVPVAAALGAGEAGEAGGARRTGGAGQASDAGEALAFDHHRILADGVERARAKLEDTGYAAALCGEAFTVADLHAVYEAVWGIELDKGNFHRKVTGVEGFLTPTGEVREGGRGRPARVYRGDPRATLSPPILRGDR